MQFQLQGKAYHAVLRNAADLEEALSISETLWVATSAPVSAFRLDKEFLKALDRDVDGRINAAELRAAVSWTLGLLTDRSGLDSGSADLSIASVTAELPEGQKIRSLLERIGGESGSVSLGKLRTWRQRLESRPVSEAGVVLPEAAETDAVRAWMSELLTVLPGVPHPSGKAGIDEATLRSFETLARKRLQWLAEAESDAPGHRSAARPLGDDSESAYQVYLQVRDALDRYFALCDLCTLDPSALDKVWPGVVPDARAGEAEIVEALRLAPIAKPSADGLLRLGAHVNPAYALDLHEFRSRLIIPFFDKTDEVLSRSDWRRVRSAMETHAAWKAREPAPELAKIAPERLRELLDSPHAAAVRGLIAGQTSAAIDLQQVRLAETLALHQAHLLTFANNFISFPHLYDPGCRAAFEEGSLFMDGRRFNLAVRVPDRAQYLRNVEGGTMFILILKLEHPARPEGLEIAVPVTAGRKGNLKTGKHGIFQDVNGKEWFATVTHICDNPVSLTEAMSAPFVRLGQLFSRKVESITQAAEKKLDQSTEALDLSTPTPPPPTPPPASAGPAASGQMLAGGGIALAALGSSLAFMTKTFSGLSLGQILGGLAVAVLAVMVPSAIVAALRLRKRDLSVLLEGAGWAVNLPMRLSRAQERAFTAKPRFPKDSRLIRDRAWWLRRILLLTLLLYVLLKQTLL